MPRYNHQVCLAFTVHSDREDGSDLDATALRAGLLQRMIDMDQTGEWEEACLPPVDTYEEE